MDKLAIKIKFKLALVLVFLLQLLICTVPEKAGPLPVNNQQVAIYLLIFCAQS